MSLTCTVAFSPGLYVSADGCTSTFEHALLRRHDDLLDLGVHLAAGDRHRLDEEVRHVLLHDGDLLDGALALQPHHLRRQIDAVGRPHEQQHRAVAAIGVDQQLDLLARRVLALVGDQLDVVEAEVAAVEALAADREDVAAFDRVLLLVGQLVRQAILPGFAGADLLPGLALVVGVHVPLPHRRFDRLAVLGS